MLWPIAAHHPHCYFILCFYCFHCYLVTHLSTSDSTTALHKFIYVLTDLLTYLLKLFYDYDYAYNHPHHIYLT